MKIGKQIKLSYVIVDEIRYSARKSVGSSTNWIVWCSTWDRIGISINDKLDFTLRI